MAGAGPAVGREEIEVEWDRLMSQAYSVTTDVSQTVDADFPSAKPVTSAKSPAFKPAPMTMTTKRTRKPQGPPGLGRRCALSNIAYMNQKPAGKGDRA